MTVPRGSHDPGRTASALRPGVKSQAVTAWPTRRMLRLGVFPAGPPKWKASHSSIRVFNSAARLGSGWAWIVVSPPAIWANEELISGGPLAMVVVELVDDLAVAEVLAQTERRAEAHGVTFRA